MTLAVVRRDEGQIYEQGYGEFARDRVSLIASTTKILSTGIVLALVDDGRLDLDRPLAEYLGWGDHHPGVNIEHLLSNMSGIKGYPEEEHPCMADSATTLRDCGRAVLHPDDGWGAILIIEHTTLVGSVMYSAIVPLIREAVLAPD